MTVLQTRERNAVKMLEEVVGLIEEVWTNLAHNNVCTRELDKAETILEGIITRIRQELPT